MHRASVVVAYVVFALTPAQTGCALVDALGGSDPVDLPIDGGVQPDVASLFQPRMELTIPLAFAVASGDLDGDSSGDVVITTTNNQLANSAVEQYRRYLAADPRGAHADDARRHIAVLTRSGKTGLDPANAAAGVEKQRRPYVAPTIIDDRPPPKPAPKWLWPTLGGIALGAGLLTDLAPDSAHDGKFTGVDLLPVGLYALSLVFVGVWVF